MLPRSAPTSFLLFVLLAGTTLTLAPAPTAAQSLEYGIPAMELRLELLPDGRMQIQERIRFRVEAGDFAEGYRRIPLGRRIEIEGVEVTSPDLEVDDVRVRRNRGSTEIEWSFPRRSASATFVLTYTVEGALQSVEGRNVIDWDPVGTDWEVPLEDVRIEVHWPDFGLDAPDIEVAPAEPARSTDAGWVATFEPGLVPAETPYRVRVSFPEQLAGAAPPEPENPLRIALLFLAAVVLGLAPGVVLHRLLGRPRPDRRHAGSEPDAADLPTLAYLSGGPMTWSQRVFPATLVSLARRGHVILRRAVEEDPEGTEGTERLEVDRVAPPDPTAGSADDLSDFEGRLLDELEGHESFEAFRKDASPFRKRAREELARSLEPRGLMVQASRRANFLMVLGVLTVLAIPLVLGLGPGRQLLGGPEAFAVLLLGATAGVGLMVAGSRRSDLTETGARIRSAHRERLADLRARIDGALESDPHEAASLLVASLEWVLLDPRSGPEWLRKVEHTLRERGIDLELPGWMIPGQAHQGSDEDEATTLAGFLPLYLLVTHATPGAAPASGAMNPGLGGAGMAASGGFGGGGGGIR